MAQPEQEQPFGTQQLGGFERARYALVRPTALYLIRQYLDESGHASNDDVVVVAGLFGLDAEWTNFDDRWNHQLLEHGTAKPLHMKDFEARQRAFRNFTDDGQRRSLLAALLDEIVQRRVYAIGAAVSMKTFSSIDWTRGFDGCAPLDNAYHMALQDELNLAIHLCKDLNNSGATVERFQMATVLAEQPEFQGMAGAYHRSVARFDSTASLVAQPAFDAPGRCPRLQAADLVAYEFRRHVLRPDLNRYPWVRLAQSRPAYFHLRGIDASLTLPGMTFRPDREQRLVLKDADQKRTRNQGRRGPRS